MKESWRLAVPNGHLVTLKHVHLQEDKIEPPLGEFRTKEDAQAGAVAQGGDVYSWVAASGSVTMHDN